MKHIYKTLLYTTTLFSLIFISNQISSAEREYRQHLKNTDWAIEAQAQVFCRIKQLIPNYGEAIFTRKSGREMIFELTSNELFLKETQIIIMAEPAPWRQNELSFEIGSFTLKEGHKPLTAGYPYASRMFQQIENGMMPTITYRDVADHRDIITIAISPIKFRTYLNDFRQCESTLFEYDPEFLRDFDLYFATNKADLTARAKKNLGHVMKYLKVNKNIKQIRVDAHADSIGRRRFNDRLSERRAKVVREYLLKMGAKEDILYIKSHGEREPANSNDTKVGRAKNRHARVQLLDTPPPPPEIEEEDVIDEEGQKHQEEAPFEPTDKMNTPVPNFINMNHLITK